MVVSLLSLLFETTLLIYEAWLCYYIIKYTSEKSQRDCRLQTNFSGVAWQHLKYCAEEYEKSCEKQTLYNTACSRIWTVKSSNEALMLTFSFILFSFMYYM